MAVILNAFLSQEAPDGLVAIALKNEFDEKCNEDTFKTLLTDVIKTVNRDSSNSDAQLLDMFMVYIIIRNICKTQRNSRGIIFEFSATVHSHCFDRKPTQ